MLAQLARVVVGLFAVVGLLAAAPAPASGGTPDSATAAEADDPDGARTPIGSLDPVGEREDVRWPTAILMTGSVFALALALAVGPQVVRWFRDGQQIEGTPAGGRGD